MMMSLDQFVFSLATTPYQELQRQRNWKHRTSSRIGVRDEAGALVPPSTAAARAVLRHLERHRVT